jgi:hypothetical protein
MERKMKEKDEMKWSERERRRRNAKDERER